jgi:hypothetical protein
MTEFLFVYRGGNRATVPAEMQQQMQRWMAWMKDLGAKGHIKESGRPLENGGAVVRASGAVTDGPYAEKDLVCGYTIVQAKDLAHAVELSAGCPIFNAGGLVEVRPIMKLDP